MRTAALALALLILAACDGGTTPTPDPVMTGIAKVSGDGQRAQVRAATGAVLSLAGVGISRVDSNDPTLLPELLVARIEFTTPSSAVYAAPSAGAHGAPRFQQAPAGTVVNWETGIRGVPGKDVRCGEPRVPVTQVFDSATVVNGWRRGTLADTTCVTRTALYRGTQLIEADSFTAVFTPGPPAVGKRFEMFEPDAPHQLLIDRRAVQDAHGNPIPFRIQVAAGDTMVWAGGTTWGTVESRTLHWRNLQGTKELVDGVFHLVDEAGARIARVMYRLYVAKPGLELASISGVTID